MQKGEIALSITVSNNVCTTYLAILPLLRGGALSNGIYIFDQSPVNRRRCDAADENVRSAANSLRVSDLCALPAVEMETSLASAIARVAGSVLQIAAM